MLNSYLIKQSVNPVINNKKSKEEMESIKREVETKEQFNVLYKDSTFAQKQTSGFSEYSDIMYYPYMIKGLLLKDGKYIDLEDAKFSCRDGLIYISKFGHYSVNLTEVKRVYYKYSYIKELKAIHTLWENSCKKYITYETNGYKDNSIIEINIGEYNKIVYFKEIEEKYAIINKTTCFSMEDAFIFIFIKLEEFVDSINRMIILNSSVNSTSSFMYIEIDRDEIIRIRKEIYEKYEKEISLTGYNNPDIKVFVRELGEYYGKIYQESNGFYSIRINGKIIEDILIKNGVEQEIYEDIK